MPTQRATARRISPTPPRTEGPCSGLVVQNRRVRDSCLVFGKTKTIKRRLRTGPGAKATGKPSQGARPRGRESTRIGVLWSFESGREAHVEALHVQLPEGGRPSRTSTIPAQGGWIRRQGTLTSDGERDFLTPQRTQRPCSELVVRVRTSFAPRGKATASYPLRLRAPKGWSFFRSLSFRPGHCGRLHLGDSCPLRVPPRLRRGWPRFPPGVTARNDEGLSLCPLQKTSPFPPPCLGASMISQPNPGLPMSYKGSVGLAPGAKAAGEPSERPCSGFVARVRKKSRPKRGVAFTPGAEAAGKPSQGARPRGQASTRPGDPWRPGPEGEAQVEARMVQLPAGGRPERMPAVPAQGGRFRRQGTLASDGERDFPDAAAD